MDEALIKRVPPHNTEAEHSVIGSMMMDREAIVTASEILSPEDFYDKTMGTYFKALCGLMSENIEADFVTIQERMRGLQVPEELCSLEYIGNLLDSVPSAANVKYYAEIVREKARLRKFIKAAEEMTGSAYLDKEETDALFDRAEKEFTQSFRRAARPKSRRLTKSRLRPLRISKPHTGTKEPLPASRLALSILITSRQAFSLPI